jgi:hypothetical protein
VNEECWSVMRHIDQEIVSTPLVPPGKDTVKAIL